MSSNNFTSEKVHNKYVGDLVLVKTLNCYKGKDYFFLDREIFIKFKEDLNKPKFKRLTDDNYRVYVTTRKGIEVALHRHLSNPHGNNEITLLNDDPTDLRMINLFETIKGKVARMVENKNQQARWIIPIEQYFQSNANNSPLPIKLEVTLKHMEGIVSVQINEKKLTLVDLMLTKE